MLAHIAESAKNIRGLDLDDGQRKFVDAGCISEKHIGAISLASSLGNFLVSFRPAGKHTLQRLEDGAAAKGHDISEKTIKEKSVGQMFGAGRSDEMLNKFTEARVSGLVAVWKEDGIDGLYLTEEGKGRLFDLGHEVHFNSAMQPYLSIDLGQMQAAEIADRLNMAFGCDGQFHKFFYTGDYDMHDLISFSSRPHQVSSGSDEEQFIIDSINIAVSAVDDLRPFKNVSHNVVRHGPQYSYIAHMRTSEPESPISPEVAGPSISPGNPVYVLNRGNAETVESVEKLVNLYRRLGVRIKDAWTV